MTKQKLDTRGKTVAAQCRKAGLKVGDTIIGREGGTGWWQESKLTLLWIGKTNCVFAGKSRSNTLPNWRDVGECGNWRLESRDWYKVEAKPAKPSKLELAADLLERHNTWRRGKDDGTPMVGAKELGQAIDTAVKHMRAGL